MSFLKSIKGKNVYHITDSDLDGVTARLVAEHYLAPICNYLPVNSAQRDMSEVDWDVALNSDVVIFTDITPSIRLYRSLIRSNRLFYIFDHHQTGKDEIGECSTYYYDSSRCGSKIFYDFLREECENHPVLDAIVELTNTYDLWLYESDNWKDAKNLSNVMYGYVNWWVQQADTARYEPFIESQLRKIEKADEFFFTPKEKRTIDTALAKEETNYNVAKKSLQLREDSEGNKYGYAECTAKISFVAHRLLREMPDKLDYIAIHGNYDSKSKKISLRSTELDISSIATKWKGGGHAQAAGMEFETKEEFEKFKAGRFHLI